MNQSAAAAVIVSPAATLGVAGHGLLLQHLPFWYQTSVCYPIFSISSTSIAGMSFFGLQAMTCASSAWFGQVRDKPYDLLLTMSLADFLLCSLIDTCQIGLAG